MTLTILSVTCTVLALFSPVAAIAVPIVPSGTNVSIGSDRHVNQARTIWVDGDRETEWPADERIRPWGKPLHVIPYCFATTESKDKLQFHIWQAIQIWMKALGGDPWEQDPQVSGAGHSVTFQWVTMNCYQDDYENQHNPGTWNIEPGWEHAVAIHLVSSGTSAKPGYKPKDKIITGPEAGRHHIFLEEIPRVEGDPKYLTPDELRAYTHEVGHVLGLGHAHQHPNAPVKIRCENLPNMDWVLDYALQKDEYKKYIDMPDGRQQLQDYLCTPENYYKAVFAGCPFTEYITNRPGMTPIGPYDPDSIMHYPTWIHWKDDEGNYHDEEWKSPMEFDPSQATMTRLLPDGSEEPFRQADVPSKNDIAAVKSHYPA
ncbi:hypothetical protein P171DRAFT_445060 [Karstenula rhodostoma CBS 690.94]|uniref:Peptidase metallopeptidase domain-containing protein n=1 Tax=Karstenula rhodostoma CBS 690.94 TaxID=1392251 RepID=A0A9P4PGG6_9PLEO|nr:hypothetical protein P171DRAFT_445060 [Karstenula rhodostoma CBS 690.94]